MLFKSCDRLLTGTSNSTVRMLFSIGIEHYVEGIWCSTNLLWIFWTHLCPLNYHSYSRLHRYQRFPNKYLLATGHQSCIFDVSCERRFVPSGNWSFCVKSCVLRRNDVVRTYRMDNISIHERTSNTIYKVNCRARYT